MPSSGHTGMYVHTYVSTPLGPVVYCVRSLVAARPSKTARARLGIFAIRLHDARAAAVDVLLRRARRQKEGVGEKSRVLCLAPAVLSVGSRSPEHVRRGEIDHRDKNGLFLLTVTSISVLQTSIAG